jgi:3-hydroxy-9,10-secoandrosta-1,3,5(10)-triene-9,17-dione monooxygenase reductase component
VGIDDGFERIGSDPFEPPLDERDPVRRLRGRLPGPVTVWTAYGEEGLATGLTVSSVLVGEGEPPTVFGLIAPDSALWDALRASKRFVVHILDLAQARIADQFALRYPGDPFEGLLVARSDYGPVLSEMGTRTRVTLMGYIDAGYSLLIQGSIDEVEVDPDPTDPLVHYRGRYFTISRRQ